jgi:hypothetical protein
MNVGHDQQRWHASLDGRFDSRPHGSAALVGVYCHIGNYAASIQALITIINAYTFDYSFFQYIKGMLLNVDLLYFSYLLFSNAD